MILMMKESLLYCGSIKNLYMLNIYREYIIDIAMSGEYSHSDKLLKIY